MNATFRAVLQKSATTNRSGSIFRPLFPRANRLSFQGCLMNQKAALSAQSGDDAAKPTALAMLHLEDGTTLVGMSFGSHKAVEGEVRIPWKGCAA